MKHLFFASAARFLAVAAALLSFTLTPALAQRTDSLMVRSDAISAYTKTYLNDVLYYIADDGLTGFELWRTDGTTAGTRLVKDIRPGKASAFVTDTSYYTGIYNSTTYRYDYDLATVRSYLRYVKPYVFKNQLYFWADDGVSGIELWQSDGTAAGTRQVVDLIPGPFNTNDQYGIFLDGYQNRFGVSAQGKLQFWTSTIQNTLFETDGTAAGTRGIDLQTTKYLTNYINNVTTLGGRTFATTGTSQKGKTYYSLQQLPESTTAVSTTLVLNSPAYPQVIHADARGPLWMAELDEPTRTSFSFFRRDSSRVKLLRRFDVPAPAVTNTRSQFVQQRGRAGDQLLFQVIDVPNGNLAGKGTEELWRLDLKTDSLRLVKRYSREQTIVSNQVRFLKGSERINAIIPLPNGHLLIQQTADTTGTALRTTISRFDGLTNQIQVLEDSIDNYNYWQYGADRKAVFMTRRGPKDAFRVWSTDGRTKQVLQTLGVSEGLILNNVPTMGLVAAQFTTNYNAKKAVTGYKMDVWRVDTMATTMARIGRVNNAFWIGTPFAVNGVLYGNNSGFLYRVSGASASDSIRHIATFNGWATLGTAENYFGIVNGKILAKPAVNSPMLLAIDPAAAPRKCLVGVTPKTRNGNPYSWIKDLAYCPAKDSVVTLRGTPLIISNNSGEIYAINPHTMQWLRDSTVMQSASPTLDSLVLRRPQQGQYTLTLRGLADGCTATDSWKLHYSAPSLALIPSQKQADRIGLTAVARGGYLNNGSTYPATWGRSSADGSVAAVAGSGDVSYYGHTTGWMDELVATKYEPRYGTYTVKITDALSCSTTTAFNFTDKTTLLNVAGGLSTLQNGATVCDQSIFSYTATASGGKSPYTYRLFADSQPIATGANSTFTAVAPGTNGTGSVNYMVEATDADGNKMLTRQQILFFAALPALSLTSTSATASVTRPVTLSATVSNYNFPTFRWAKDGQVITGVAGRSLSATSGGVYSVTAGSGTVQNCQRVTQLALVTGSGRVAATVPEKTPERTYVPGQIAGAGGGTLDPLSPQSQLIRVIPTPEPTRRGELQVMPNPARDVTRLQLDLPRPAGVAGTLLTTDGKVLQTWEDARPFEQYTTEVNLGSQPAGVYLLRIEAGGQTYTKRIVKQ